jgi:hypothetical protein
METRSSTQNQQPREDDDKHGHFIANCPFERRDNDNDKKKSKFYKKDKGYKKMIRYTRRSPTTKLTLIKNGSPRMRASTLIVMV